MDEQSFLDNIAEDPDNETTYLVYADWLEDRGETERAELIRLEVEAAQIPHWSPDKYKHQTRIYELVSGLRSNWPPAQELPNNIFLNWPRGLPTELLLPWNDKFGVPEAELRAAFKFPFLRSFRAAENFPPEHLALLADCRKLQTLHLHGVTEQHIEPLLALTQLRELTLGRHPGPFLPHLKTFPRLERLDLYGALTDEDCVHFSQLSNLRSLQLSVHGITDVGLSHIGSLAQLEKLHLFEISLTEAACEHMGRLRNLRNLSLHDCWIEDEGVALFEPLQQLTSLAITRAGISERVYPSISKLKKLRQLDLSYNDPLFAEGLSHLELLCTLEELDLAGTHVSLEDIQPLLNFPSLKYFRTSMSMWYQNDEGVLQRIEGWEKSFREKDILMDVHWE